MTLTQGNCQRHPYSIKYHRMKKTNQMFCVVIGLLFSLSVRAQTIASDVWEIDYNTTAKTADFIYRGNTILTNVVAQVKNGSTLLKSSDYTDASITSAPISDSFGSGTQYVVELTSPDKPTMQQIFYLYQGLSYFLTEVKLISDQSLSSNYMAPVVTSSTNTFLTSADANNRMLFVPYDNDAWVQYNSMQLNQSTTSYEVTSIFSGNSRNGLVIGSVEHDTWKTGINLTGSGNQSITNIECYGGITSNLTRDALPHGSITGTTVKSPKVFVGFYDDWRKGMDEYGVANVNVSGKLKWDRPTPFGWSSWGAFLDKVNIAGIIQVSTFINSSLQNDNFHNDDNTVYLNLDSYWDNMSDQELNLFVTFCKQNGQLAGIYWSPFTDWGNDPNRAVEGTTGYLYKDVYLYALGQPRSLDGAYAVDPTHPAVKQRIDYYLNRFHNIGFKYIKLDFLTHGALEADSHYDPTVTTGTQAYNAGMKYLSDELLRLDPDIFITQSICPLFPAQYGHARRIACDAYGSISDTEYTMNGLSYGWWLDNVYTYNDPDNVAFVNPFAPFNVFTEGENRARTTSVVITGIYNSGDNYSTDGTLPGNPIARTRAQEYLTNPDINDIARMGKAFYPVRGYQPSADKGAENIFMYNAGQYLYLVIFNYTNSTINAYVTMDEVGLDMNTAYAVKELWSGTNSSVTGTLSTSVPMMDVQVFRIETGAQSSINNPIVPHEKLSCFVDHQTKNIEINSDEPFVSFDIFSVQGIKLLSKNGLNNTNYNIGMSSFSSGCYIVRVETAKGKMITKKIVY